MRTRARPRTRPRSRENENKQSETTEGEDGDQDNNKKKTNKSQQAVEPKKKNACNRQFRSKDSDGNKKPNTMAKILKKKNEKKRTKKPCHRRMNQNLPLRGRVARRPPSKDALRLLM